MNEGECTVVNVVLKCCSDDIENGDHMVDQRHLAFETFFVAKRKTLSGII